MLPDCDPNTPNVPGYRLMRVIGRGAFGEVWLAEETANGALRAVKILHSDDGPAGGRQAIELDGVAQYRLVAAGRPNLLQILDVVQTPECAALVMELADDGGEKVENSKNRQVETDASLPSSDSPVAAKRSEAGPLTTHHSQDRQDACPTSYRPKTLAAVLESRAGKRMPPAEALAVTRQVLEGLAVLHQNGLVHRDVKPANVIYVGGAIKLGDAGLVSAMNWRLGRSGSIGYVPPDERLDHSRDLYAAGKLLYAMLTGWHASQFPDLPRDWPPDNGRLAEYQAAIQVMNKAAHPAAGAGFATAGEMVKAISRRRRGSLWHRHALVMPTVVAILTLAIAAAIRGISSVGRPPAGEPLAVQPQLVSVRNNSEHEIELRFSDGGFAVVAPGGGMIGNAAPVDLAGDGRRLLVVGFHASARDEYAGAIAAFDPLELRSGRESVPLFRTSNCENPPAIFRERQSPCSAKILWVGDLDGVPGDEFIVAFSQYRGPAELVVYGRGWSRLGEYWHFGWPVCDPTVAPVSLETDGRRCIAFPMIANRLAEGTPRSLAAEEYSTAILVLDHATLLRPIGSTAPGFWSINEWMNGSSGQPPVRYGHSPPWHARGSGEWYLTWLRLFAGHPTVLQLSLMNGLEIDLDGDLMVQDVRTADPLNSAGPIPDPGAVWKRTWPP